MKKSRFFSELLFVSLLFALLPATAKAGMWDVPVAPGESFRWIFVRSELTDATSTDISYYNDFVNSLADHAATPITDVVGFSSIAEIEWKAIVSTQDGTNAIDNIGESPAGIYTPDGRPVAYGTADLFDGQIINPINTDEYGHPPPPNGTSPSVWTGTAPDGYGIGMSLGYMFPIIVGYSDSVGLGWISSDYGYNSDMHSLYAISEELTVVPAPGAIILAATGLLSSTLGLKRLRHKHQE